MVTPPSPRLVPVLFRLAAHRFAGAALHQDFRIAALSEAMALGLIEGDFTLLELLGFSLAVLSIWFWTS